VRRARSPRCRASSAMASSPWSARGADLELGPLDRAALRPLRAQGRAASAARATRRLVPRACARCASASASGSTIAPTCACAASTDHGHCGVLERGYVQNDATLPLLAEMALAPRARRGRRRRAQRHDGRRVARSATRSTARASRHRDPLLLDQVRLGFYGPFREAADSRPKSGDRRAYQLDPRNARAARRESELDEAEGADMLMVQARARLPGRDRGRARGDVAAPRGLQRLGRVQHGQGRGRARLDRRGRGRARDPAGHDGARAPTWSSATMGARRWRKAG
jgi:hypothetical protein